MAEEMKETMEQYENELEASFRKMDEGDIVEGDVLSVSDEEAVIDLKYYAQGILKASEYSDDPNVTLTEALNEGDRVKAKVISVDDGEGNIMRLKGKPIRFWPGTASRSLWKRRRFSVSLWAELSTEE